MRPAQLQIRGLEIRKFRDVAPGTAVRFDPGFNVLLGHNGSGKTALLELISRIARSDFSALRDEPFDLTYTLRASCPPQLGAGALEVELEVHLENAERPASDITDESPHPLVAVAEIEVRNLTPSQDSSDRLHVRLDGSATSIQVRSRRPVSRPPIPVLESNLLWRLVLQLPAHFQLYPDLWTAPEAWRFDEGLGCFDALCGRAAGTGPTPRLTLSRTAQNEVRLARADHVPPDLLGALMLGESSIDLTGRRVRLGKLDSLQRLLELLGFTDGSATPLLKEKRVEPDREACEYLGFEFQFTRRNGTMVTADLLSFGQKRLLTFFYFAGAHLGPVIADELVNGMQSEWIAASVAAIGSRQSFLSSQSPLLLDHLRLESAEQAGARLILCTTALDAGRERLEWRNISAEDAEEIYGATQLGVHLLGEVLRAKRAW